jgi:hypothetical protein
MSVMLLVLVRVGVPARQRPEYLYCGREGDVFAVEHLSNRGVIGSEDRAFANREWKVQVADHPAEPRSVDGVVAERDLQNGLRFLLNDVGCLFVRENEGAIRQRPFKIEPKLATVFRNPAPAAFRQHLAVDRNRDASAIRVTVRQRMVNDFHDRSRG